MSFLKSGLVDLVIFLMFVIGFLLGLSFLIYDIVVMFLILILFNLNFLGNEVFVIRVFDYFIMLLLLISVVNWLD